MISLQQLLAYVISFCCVLAVDKEIKGGFGCGAEAIAPFLYNVTMPEGFLEKARLRTIEAFHYTNQQITSVEKVTVDFVIISNSSFFTYSEARYACSRCRGGDGGAGRGEGWSMAAIPSNMSNYWLRNFTLEQPNGGVLIGGESYIPKAVWTWAKEAGRWGGMHFSEGSYCLDPFACFWHSSAPNGQPGSLNVIRFRHSSEGYWDDGEATLRSQYNFAVCFRSDCNLNLDCRWPLRDKESALRRVYESFYKVTGSYPLCRCFSSLSGESSYDDTYILAAWAAKLTWMGSTKLFFATGTVTQTLSLTRYETTTASILKTRTIPRSPSNTHIRQRTGITQTLSGSSRSSTSNSLSRTMSFTSMQTTTLTSTRTISLPAATISPSVPPSLLFSFTSSLSKRLDTFTPWGAQTTTLFLASTASNAVMTCTRTGGGQDKEGVMSRTRTLTRTLTAPLFILRPIPAPTTPPMPIPISPDAGVAMSVVSAAGSASAVLDVQTSAVVAVASCASSGRKAQGSGSKGDGLYRSLSVFALEDSCEGVVRGNCVFLCVLLVFFLSAGALLRCLGGKPRGRTVEGGDNRRVATDVSNPPDVGDGEAPFLALTLIGIVERLRGRVGASCWSEAFAHLRCPSLLVVALAYTMNSFAVCGVWYLREGARRRDEADAYYEHLLLGVILWAVVVCIVGSYPLLTYFYGTRRYYKVLYNRRALGPRLYALARTFLPRGDLQGKAVAQVRGKGIELTLADASASSEMCTAMLGSVLGGYHRPEAAWPLVACVSAVCAWPCLVPSNESPASCLAAYSISSALHFVAAGALLRWLPRRVVFTDALHSVSLGLNGVVVALGAANMARDGVDGAVPTGDGTPYARAVSSVGTVLLVVSTVRFAHSAVVTLHRPVLTRFFPRLFGVVFDTQCGDVVKGSEPLKSVHPPQGRSDMPLLVRDAPAVEGKEDDRGTPHGDEEVPLRFLWQYVGYWWRRKGLSPCGLPFLSPSNVDAGGRGVDIGGNCDGDEGMLVLHELESCATDAGVYVEAEMTCDEDSEQVYEVGDGPCAAQPDEDQALAEILAKIRESLPLTDQTQFVGSFQRALEIESDEDTMDMTPAESHRRGLLKGSDVNPILDRRFMSRVSREQRDRSLRKGEERFAPPN